MPNDETVRHFLLQITATNLGNFIFDNDDLSTIRGAGLLLLNSGKFLCGEPDRPTSDNGEDDPTPLPNSFFSRTGNGSYEQDGVGLDLVASGASTTLFRFQATDGQAKDLGDAVDRWLREHERLRHATFAVTTIGTDENEEKFCTSVERSLTKTRLVQMRAPNVSVGRIQAVQTKPSPYHPTGFCDIDHKRTRAADLKRKDDQGNPEPWYAKAADKNHASTATAERRAYGRDIKVRLYQMIADAGEDFASFHPAWEFEEIGRHGSWCVSEDRDEDNLFHTARDKMAVIYIDGNEFGSLFRDRAERWDQYRDEDSTMRDRRRDLMRSLVRHIKDEPRWQFKVPEPLPQEPKSKTRIETLLWGGDELIWVVPAWCGLETVRFFFRETSSDRWRIEGHPLTHAVGVVFCSYKSPIRSVVSLAKKLAESVKDQLKDLATGDSLVPTRHRESSNAMAYEVLESFDHLGREFAAARADQRMPQMEKSDAILTAKGLGKIGRHLHELKRLGFPRGRVHQIVQILRRSALAVPEVKGKSDDDAAKSALNDTVYGKLIQRAAKTAECDTAELERLLNDPLHWGCLSKLPAKWFHLMELWDYAGSREAFELAPDSPTDRTRSTES